ncbi:MarR family transcriptional regulator [Streptomyces sp. V4-01]|uniref:MarR family transcriptional regulator n=1 Tax=Actinacidiphila polyblastidii TaxID=3110430 RepID=A0ABU7PIW3_9ACTN|nr:MarR family transcriptional regulator [Streptomyces sp. V4-01]
MTALGSTLPADGDPADGGPADGDPADGGPVSAGAADGSPVSADPVSADGGPADGSPARVATDLRIALGPLVRRLRRFRPDGELTLSQTSALVRLDREGPATSSELAAAEGIRPQSMCTIVNALLERGLVSRAQDPADGRRMVVSLSPAGRAGLHGARAERARRLAEAIEAELTPRERRQLAEAIPLLERITRRV